MTATMKAVVLDEPGPVTNLHLRYLPVSAPSPWLGADQAVPTGRAARLRPVRAAAGIGLIQRQARLPVPPRPHQRYQPGPPPTQEHLRA